MRSDLPTGTVTSLLMDGEGSTRLLHEFGSEEYSRVLAERSRVLREMFGASEGVEVDTQGEALFVALLTAPSALGAAAEALAGVGPGADSGARACTSIRGTPHVAEEAYVSRRPSGGDEKALADAAKRGATPRERLQHSVRQRMTDARRRSKQERA